jgi:hypothetical protein
MANSTLCAALILMVGLASVPGFGATPELVCATYLGTAGDDDLQDVAIAADGTIYVVGNIDRAMTDLPGGAKPAILGEPLEGTWYRCGFVAALSADGSKILRGVQFARGQVFLTTIQLTGEGVYIGGYGMAPVSELFEPLGGLFAGAKEANAAPLPNPLPTPPDPPDASRPSRPGVDESGRPKSLTIQTRHHGDKGGVPLVLRLNRDLTRLEAGTFLEGHLYAWNIMMPRYEEEWTPTGLVPFPDGDLGVLHDGGAPIHHYYAPDYLSRLTPDLKKRIWRKEIYHPEIGSLDKIRARREGFKEWKYPVLGQIRTLRTRGDGRGNLYVGGWSVSMTSREPWWCPFLWKFNADGDVVWKAYSYDPMGGSGGRVGGLVSDSAIRSMAVDGGGGLLVAGISDGGNTVLQRDPRDYRKPPSGMRRGFGGMHGRELYVGHLMRLDAESRDLRGGTMLGSHGKDGYQPTWAVDVAPLPGDRLLAVGRHSENHPVTGDAWFQTESDRGMFIQVRSSDFDRLFSVNVPDAIPYSAVCRGSRGVVVGMAESDSAPVRNACAGKHAGGLDAYLLVVDFPE